MESNSPFVDPAAIADSQLSKRKQWTTRNALQEITKVCPGLTSVQKVIISAIMDRVAEHYVFEGHKKNKHGKV